MRIVTVKPGMRKNPFYYAAPEWKNVACGHPSVKRSKPSFETNAATRKQPAVNIKETGTEFNIELAAPGIAKEEFNINIEKDVLTISASKEQKEGTNYTRREFNYFSFERSFVLPETVDTTAISAAYNNGILSITLPKVDSAREKPARRVEVK